MIIKILEELREVRIKQDYKNYRTLVNALFDYLKTETFDLQLYEINNEIIEKIKTYKKWIYSELEQVKEITENELTNKNYGDFKITSQSYNELRYIFKRLSDISKPFEKVNKHIKQL